MTARRRALEEAMAICQQVEARWAMFHSVAPSAAAECAYKIAALWDAAPADNASDRAFVLSWLRAHHWGKHADAIEFQAQPVPYPGQKET